ncbi:MAG: hypothetical protein LBJ22_06770 [Synergistaceae bacterium]|jgi:nitrogen regulatory protein PII|nr:hypothetical protein [Synergistaceae bacterium]
MEHESHLTPPSPSDLSSSSLSSSNLPLMLVIVICDRGKEKKIMAFFKDRNATFNLLTLGKGTANSKILNYLGLGQIEKAILFSIMPSKETRDVLSKVDETLDLKHPGHGIAFTLPLEGTCLKQTAIDGINQGDEGEQVEREFQHVLILAVTNRGYNQEVMDAARAAKATGGTIIHARGLALSGAEKFLGVSIYPEKEIIMILAESERKRDIMQAIAEKAGVGTPASAVTFSMPVCDVEGLQSFLPQTHE